MICLTHIPKTGGTTFRNILINNFSWRHIDFPNIKRDFIHPWDFPLNTRLHKHIKSLSGHRLRYSQNLKSYFPEFKFVAFIRDPLSRIISLFFHLQKHEALKLNFDQWVLKNASSRPLNNFQTHFICGSEDFNLARKIIDDQFFFVGSTSKFDHSLLIFKKMIKTDFDIHYVRKNISNRDKSEILNDTKNLSALDLIARKNKQDFQLYKYVNEKLMEKYQVNFGTISDNDIVDFQESNKKFIPNAAKKKVSLIVKYGIFENLFRIL